MRSEDRVTSAPRVPRYSVNSCEEIPLLVLRGVSTCRDGNVIHGTVHWYWIHNLSMSRVRVASYAVARSGNPFLASYSVHLDDVHKEILRKQMLEET